MKVCVVSAHPNPASLTQALADAFCQGLVQAGHEPERLDLYQQAYEPVVQQQEYLAWRQGQLPEPTRRYQSLLQDCQGLALVYPIWWATPPALLQGWLQRTFTYGFAFVAGPQGPQGLLRHKVQLIVNASSAGAEAQAHYIEPMRGVMRFCGIEHIDTILNTGVTAGEPDATTAALVQRALAAGRAF